MGKSRCREQWNESTLPMYHRCMGELPRLRRAEEAMFCGKHVYTITSRTL